MKTTVFIINLLLVFSTLAADTPLKSGADSVYYSTPIKVDIDLRSLPTIREWSPGDPIKEIPRRYYPISNPEPGNDTGTDNYIDLPFEKQKAWDATNNARSNRAFNTTIIAQDVANSTGVSPPDTVGDVGIDYYIHSYNGTGGSLFQIFNKSDGTAATGVLAMDSIVDANTGNTVGNCGGGNGDPIIIFDEMAGKWVLTEFTSSGNAMCVYVSQTGDPIAGGWFVYQFVGANGFPDYPKYGVWSDAYYIGTNEGISTLYALDRTQMLLGNIATMQQFNATNLSGFGFQMIVPADHDGDMDVKAGAPGLFMRHMDDEVHSGSCGGGAGDDCLQIYDFNVDWGDANNSSVSNPVNILISDFDSNLCGFAFVGCVSQPGSGTTLDPLREVIMWRLQYRNFGSYETLVANLETDADGNDKHGIRWFELRRTTGLDASDWSLYQEGTWADAGSSHKWMGSAAMDSSGNIAVAYSTSSGTAGDFPSLKYAGRLSTDPLNVLTTGESTIVNGSASQSNLRWGDYSSLSVDPVDGCTFWFSSEYTPTSNWRTHLSSFKFDECGNPGFTLATSPASIDVCVNPSPANAPDVTITTTSILSFSDPITMGFNPILPTGFSSSFSVNPVIPGNNSVLTLTVNNTATAGSHTITVEGDAFGTIEQSAFDVFVSLPVSTSPTLISPFNGETGVTTLPSFSWNVISGASNYDIDIATDAAFLNIIETGTVSTNSYTPASSLNASTQYFWRVRATNSCGNGNYSSTSSFTTANITTVTLCSIPGSSIPDNNAAGLDDTINFSQDITITDVDITLDVSHTYVSDLSFTVTNDGTATSTIIIDRPGNCSSNDILTTIDDDNGAPVENECSATPPAIGAGPFTPNNPLSVFDGQAAMNNWTLNIEDQAGADTGTLNGWCVVITGTPVVQTPDIVFSGNNLSQDVCVISDPTATTPVTLNVTSLNNYNNTIALAFNPAPPNGISGGFSNNNFVPAAIPGTDSILNMNVTNAASPGINTVTVEASGMGISTKSVDVDLNVIFGLSTSPILSTPFNGSISVSTNTSFTWAAMSGASTYDIEISDDPGFSNIIDSATDLATTSYTPGVGLNNATFYYWRVRASNTCNTTAYTVFAFETAGGSGTSTSTVCNSTDVSIPNNNVNGVNRVLTVPALGGGTITDINVTLEANHRRVGELIVSVRDNTTNTSVIIIDRPGFPAATNGCTRRNILTTLDDAAGTGVEGICTSQNLAIGAGPYIPNNLLSGFNGKQSTGNWTLNIADVSNGNNNVGTFRDWCLVATVSIGSPVNPADYSDLNSSYGIAKHEGGGTSKLGPTWSDDSFFTEDYDNDGGVNVDGSDDGITASGIWLPNSPDAELTVDSSGGFVACWFDWDNDGAFSNGEKTIAQDVIAGMVDIPLVIPLSSTFGSIGDDFLETRCRFYGSEPLFINKQEGTNKSAGQSNNRASETATGTALTGEVEDYRFTANELTPVTLAFTKGMQRSSGFGIDWTTTTEIGTIGFNIYAYRNGQWDLLNDQPISAKGINAVMPNDYSFQSNALQVESYKIEELTTRGMKNTYGPFANQLTYGRTSETNTKINWQQIQIESDAKLQQRQSLIQNGFDFIKVIVSKTGVQRISYQDLIALGIDWQGIAADDISISFENQVVARYVSSDIFADGEYIEFIGKPASSLYTQNNVYQLSIDSGVVKKQTDIAANSFVIDTQTYHMANSRIDADLLYSFASPDVSPWFNESLLVYRDLKSWDYPISTLSLIDNGIPASLEYKIWGGTDWPQSSIDHHVQIVLNNQQITDFYGNGLQLFNESIAIDDNLLLQNNTIKIVLPANTGVDYDLVQLDYLAISYPAEVKAKNGFIHFTPVLNSGFIETIFKNSFESSTFDSGFVVKGFSQANISAYAYDENRLYRFNNVTAILGLEGLEVELPYVESNAFKYYVTQVDQVIVPQLQLATNTPVVLTGQYDYLIITHPDFKTGLNPLISYHQSQGLKVLVTGTEDIYAQYSHHRVDANAIKTYIEEASQQMGISAVLLVGADSYDYLNNLNIGSVSFVPTLYFSTDSLINFTPVDSKYADVDNDLIPDLAIGRLPVRTEQDLVNIVNKTLNFANRSYQSKAVFATDRSASFDEFSDQMIALLPQNWIVDKAYINQLELNGAQSMLINSIEAGVTLTNFFGHSGFSSWSFERLFDTSDILALNNIDKATVVNQFGCWNTYYVMPEIKTMADYFMQQENKGAVAVMGASTLTESFHESKLGNLLLPRLTQSNTSIGQAILQAKQSLASEHPDYLDVIMGWTLLGDPMLEIND